jgi:hypothetical protein
LERIADVLHDKSELSQLYLGNSQIGDAGAQNLVVALHDKPNLSVLNVGGNSIRDAVLLELAEVLIEEAPNLKHLDLSNNPITNETEYILRGILKHVPSAYISGASGDDCPSLCPGGSLHNPNATFLDGSQCWEQEELCALGSCGSCATKQFNSLSSECCGEKKKCPVECPAGMVFDGTGHMVLPGYGLDFVCDDAREHSENGALPPMRCDEMTMWMGKYTGCCT